MDHPAQACAVVAAPHRLRQGEQADEHRRHELRVGDMVALDQAEGLRRVEFLHDDAGAALLDCVQGEAVRGGVVQRRRRQVDRAGVEAGREQGAHGRPRLVPLLGGQ